jgi:cell division protein ZapE
MSQFPNTTTVSQAYSTLVARGSIENDAAQRALVRKFDALREALVSRRLSSKASSLGWLFSRNSKSAKDIKGLYIHGGVGRGKSMLMDIFFSLAPGQRKRRVHFNEFMRDAHARIHAHRQAFERGDTREEDPIAPVGRDLANGARLLCFDEFAITDIADAMIVGRLFSTLFEAGTVVVATCNTAPDELYRDGLNRQLFLPFIDLIKQRCEVFELDARTDYRLEKLAGAKVYLAPNNEKARQRMESLWAGLTEGANRHDGRVRVGSRSILPSRAAGRCAWFTFRELCEKPRGANDYLALVEQFDTIFLEDVPMMDFATRNQAKRFILLIDTLYDNDVFAVISAAANPHALYSAGSGAEKFEFPRAASRLIEMQSKQYLERIRSVMAG